MNDAISKVHEIVETKQVASVLGLFCAGVIAMARNQEGNTNEKQGGEESVIPNETSEKDMSVTSSIVRVYFFFSTNTQDWLKQHMRQLPLFNELFLTKYFLHGNLDIGFDLKTLYGCEDQSFREEALWEGTMRSEPVKQGHENYKNIQGQRRGAIDLNDRKKQARRQDRSEDTSAEQSAAVEKDKKSNDKQKLSTLGEAMVEQMFNKYDNAGSGSLDVAAANRMQNGIGSAVFHSEKAFHELCECHLKAT